MVFPLIRRRNRRGAVVFWVLAALVLGVLLVLCGFWIWQNGWWIPPDPGTKEEDVAPPPKPKPPEPQASGALRVTQEGVEWRGETVPLTDLQRVAELIAKDAEDQRIRVIYAADVDHLIEKRVQDVLKSAGVTEIPSHEKK